METTKSRNPYETVIINDHKRNPYETAIINDHKRKVKSAVQLMRTATQLIDESAYCCADEAKTFLRGQLFTFSRIIEDIAKQIEIEFDVK